MLRVSSTKEHVGKRSAVLSRAGALLLASTLGLGGCATTRALFPHGESEPLPSDSPVRTRTLATSDAWLRHYLILRDTAAAVAYLGAGGESKIGDPLLRALQAGVVARSAGDYVRSNAFFDEADHEIERRRVVSVTQAAGSYLVSDRLLSYLPAEGEIAMIPFYRMMNYLTLGEPQNAAVEARRIGALLDTASPEVVGGCRAAAMLNYSAGLVFEAAGELNDALVSLRRAESNLFGCAAGTTEAPAELRYDISRVASAVGLEEFVDSVSAMKLANQSVGSARGEVVVLLEHGFVAHRAEGAIHVPIYEEELEELSGDDGEAIAEVGAAVTARLIDNFAERGYYGASWDDQPFVQIGQALGGAHIIRLAWSELRGVRSHPAQLRVLSPSDTVHASPYTDLSSIAEQKLSSERVAALGRIVTRGITKFLAARAVEQKAEKQGGELAGFVAARLSNLAVNATERADTRGWTLLPRQLSVARLTLAAGEQELTVQSYDRHKGEWVDVSLGTVMVEPGRTTIVNRRIWDDTAEEEEGWEGTERRRLQLADSNPDATVDGDSISGVATREVGLDCAAVSNDGCMEMPLVTDAAVGLTPSLEAISIPVASTPSPSPGANGGTTSFVGSKPQ